MTTTHKDALRDLLFADDGCRLVNLKLMRGDNQDVSEQELRDEIHLALMEVKDGSCQTFDKFPERTKGFGINLEVLAATL